MPYIIAIDVGTTHCKAITVDERAKTIQAFKATVNSIQPHECFHEQDAEEIFQIVVKLLQQSIQTLDQHKIACISFSAAMHSLLAIDKNGNPLINAITWAD